MVLYVEHNHMSFNSGLETIPIQTGNTSKLNQLHWKKFFKILLPSVLGTMPDEF